MQISSISNFYSKNNRTLSLLILLLPFNLFAYTVILDPGHGGIFAGAIGPNKLAIEKNIVLDIAIEAANLFKRNKDINVILTRNSDKNFDKDLLNDLANRVKIANNNKANLFVAIHCNSADSHRVKGFEVYVPMFSKYINESYIAAGCFHRLLSQYWPKEWCGTLLNVNNRDRGIRAAKFNVFNNINCAAVLLELEYISNIDGEKSLTDPSVKKELAQLIYKGILNYFKKVNNPFNLKINIDFKNIKIKLNNACPFLNIK